MANQLLITKKGSGVLSVKVEDGKIAQIQAQPENEQALLGNIYVGKVRNIVKNINAAFVEYELGKMAYLSLEVKSMSDTYGWCCVGWEKGAYR